MGREVVKLFLDTEFNGFNGELISMALVPEDGSEEFYECLVTYTQYNPWVERHVVPFLGKDKVTLEHFQSILSMYLKRFESTGFTVIADWPEDLVHFNKSLITAPGVMLNVPGYTCVLNRKLYGISKIPHNALEDAKAYRDAHRSVI